MKTKAAALCALAVVCWLAVNALAQTPPLSLGQVSSVTQLASCPSTNVVPFASGMDSCYTATVTGCQGALNIPLVFAYKAATATPLYGTIVLLSGSGGSDPSVGNFFVNGVGYDNYYNYPGRGYNVVEIAWGSYQQQPSGSQSFAAMPWEDTTNNCTGSCNPAAPPPNFQAAACRPATFLNYIATHPAYYTAGTGMCAQGFSGGAAALAYTLTWYGAGAWYGVGDPRNGYLDKALMVSGPVFSNIELGCEVSEVQPTVTVCQGTPGLCQSGGAAWTSAPIAYVGNDVQSMQVYTGDSTCAGSNFTSPQSNANWLAMSIVEGNASFTYPRTVVTGFACGSINPDVPESSMNNSSTQAWLFFNNSITAYQSSVNFYEATNCSDAEGVYGNAQTKVPALHNEPGFNAILDDMSSSQNTGTMVCQYNHGK